MIIGSLNDCNKYIFNKQIKYAFDYIESINLSTLSEGKHILDNHIFMIKERYKTIKVEESFWESHKKYIDIQIMIKGLEMIAYSPLHRLIDIAYDEKKDLVIHKGSVNSFIQLSSEQFAIFFPEDAHIPGLICNTADIVDKLIIKIPIL